MSNADQERDGVRRAVAERLEVPRVEGLRIIRPLARGGFAEVWEAEQVSLGRRVAVKFLRHEHLAQEQFVRLFEQEARVLARLNHANVVQVIDRGSTDQGPYFVMEYVEGETLQRLLAKGRLTRDRALTILLHAARGLAYAHRNRVIHRDVKPANILISRGGQVKIGDFGIATVRARATAASEASGGGMPLGTRAYMAPEQRVSFDDVGPQADVYSLGVILHKIMTGRLPPAPGEVHEPEELPERLRRVLETALAPTPQRRFPDAGAFREALVTALEGRHLDSSVRQGAAGSIGDPRGFELLDVIRQDERRSVYLVRRGGARGERIVVKRYVKDPEALATIRELCRLEHPNVVRIHAVGERDDSFIMLMEHLPGGDLRERLVRPHGWRETAQVALAVARALAFTARHGIVHGNLRPSNVLFDSRGRIRVTDFGLPEHYRGEPGKRNWYADPESTGPTRSTADDLYALGAIMYEMLFAAAVPPEAGSRQAMVACRALGAPGEFASILGRLIAPRSERYAEPSQVVRDLERLLHREQPQARADPVEPDDAAAGEPTDAPAPEIRVAWGPALLGLAGLVFVWLLERAVVTEFLAELVARWIR